MGFLGQKASLEHSSEAHFGDGVHFEGRVEPQVPCPGDTSPRVDPSAALTRAKVNVTYQIYGRDASLVSFLRL